METLNTVGCRYNVVQNNMIIMYSIAVAEVEYKSEFESTKYTPYLTLMGELWGVFCEDFGEKRPHYISTALRGYHWEWQR